MAGTKTKERAGPKYPAKPKHEKSGSGRDSAFENMDAVELTQEEWDAIHNPPPGKDAWCVYELRDKRRPGSGRMGDGRAKPGMDTALGVVGDLRDREIECEACGTYICYVWHRKLVCIGCNQPITTIKAEVVRLATLEKRREGAAKARAAAASKGGKGKGTGVAEKTVTTSKEA